MIYHLKSILISSYMKWFPNKPNVSPAVAMAAEKTKEEENGEDNNAEKKEE